MAEALGTPSVRLPFPPAGKNSGHARYGGGRAQARVTKKLRADACTMAKAANIKAPATGDIVLHIHFVPPHNGGDRANYLTRCKGYIDGIADALHARGRPFNDKRFIPELHFEPAQKPGWVLFRLEPVA